MQLPTKILVPVDLSERSEVAIDYAAKMAEKFDATLVLAVNVNLHEQAVLEEYAEAEDRSIDQAAEDYLFSLAEKYAPGRAVSVVVSFEDFAAEGILRAMKLSEADAVVIASHGRTGMTRWALGSVAEKIARSSDMPVTIIPARGT